MWTWYLCIGSSSGGGCVVMSLVVAFGESGCWCLWRLVMTLVLALDGGVGCDGGWYVRCVW